MELAGSPLNFTDDVDLLLDVMPLQIRKAIEAEEDYSSLVEIVLDLGRRPEAYYYNNREQLSIENVSREDIRYVVERIGKFTDDNRSGIERTLHRISAIRNRRGEIIGLTCRIGRAIFGTVDIVRDVIEKGNSLLLLGRPGVGKTTLLREAARVLADDLGKRVVIVDTSNEIGGDGDIPHPGIGRARRMQVVAPNKQHAVMIEAVENHMPEVIVIDEIGTEAEALAARTIAERGVQLVATAHGNTLENLLQNPTLSDVVGGVQTVTLSDEEARRRRTQKTVLERKAPPTFNILVEIQDRNQLAVYHDVAATVDAFLRGSPLRREVRIRTEEGRVEIQEPEAVIESAASAGEMTQRVPIASRGEAIETLRIFTYGVSRSRLGRIIQKLQVPVYVVTDIDKADLLMILKSQERRLPKRFRNKLDQGLPLRAIRSNTVTQMESFLRSFFGLTDRVDSEEAALQEAKEAITEVFEKGHPVELSPHNSHLRRLQHELAERYGLISESKGKEPRRRVLIYPAREGEFSSLT